MTDRRLGSPDGAGTRKSPCETCAHRARGAFRHLTPGEAAEVTAEREGGVYPPGRFVASAGQPGHGPILVCSGTLKVLATDPGGNERFLTCVGPCTILWHGFERGGLPWSLVAATQSQVSFLRQSRFLELLRRHPRIAEALIADQQREIRHLRALVAAGRTQPVRSRLGAALWDLSSRLGPRPGQRMNRLVGLSRRDLADLIGSTVESVVRSLRTLGDQGIIRKEGRQIVILDPDHLKRIGRIDRPPKPYALQAVDQRVGSEVFRV